MELINFGEVFIDEIKEVSCDVCFYFHVKWLVKPNYFSPPFTTFLCMYVCMYVFMYVCMYVYIYIYIYIDI